MEKRKPEEEAASSSSKKTKPNNGAPRRRQPPADQEVIDKHLRDAIMPVSKYKFEINHDEGDPNLWTTEYYFRASAFPKTVNGLYPLLQISTAKFDNNCPPLNEYYKFTERPKKGKAENEFRVSCVGKFADEETYLFRCIREAGSKTTVVAKLAEKIKAQPVEEKKNIPSARFQLMETVIDINFGKNESIYVKVEKSEELDGDLTPKNEHTRHLVFCMGHSPFTPLPASSQKQEHTFAFPFLNIILFRVDLVDQFRQCYPNAFRFAQAASLSLRNQSLAFKQRPAFGYELEENQVLEGGEHVERTLNGKQQQGIYCSFLDGVVCVVNGRFYLQSVSERELTGIARDTGAYSLISYPGIEDSRVSKKSANRFAFLCYVHSGAWTSAPPSNSKLDMWACISNGILGITDVAIDRSAEYLASVPTDLLSPRARSFVPAIPEFPVIARTGCLGRLH